MTIFAEKLGRLTQTIALVGARGAANIGDAMTLGRGRIAIAIGCGTSAVAAEYFARCRTTLDIGATFVMTPMQFVLSLEEWAGVEIWLFDAGADDPDIAAALRCALSSRSEAVRLVTARPTAAATAHPRSAVFVLPVAEAEDDFLAPHAITTMIVALLIASDCCTERPQGRELAETFQRCAVSALDDDVDAAVAGFRRGDTVFAIHDPQVSTVGVLLETCLWETGIAPVQRTDFRNFTHGRRAWAERYPETIFALALTTRESEEVWQPIDAGISARVRRGTLSLSHGGRLANAVGIFTGFAVIARLGELADLDPGRAAPSPGTETRGGDASLLALAEGLTPAVRHKAAARQLHDPPVDAGVSLCMLGRDRLRDLGQARFAGIVLDYDGTIVPNEPSEARFGPPSAEVMDALVRLADRGVRIGFATGRGGSAGDRLREALPERIHRHVLVGYFNGGHVRTLDINIRHDRPEPDSGVAAVATWLRGSDLLRDSDFLASEVQLTINRADVRDVSEFAGRLSSCPEIAAGKARILGSHHSFDIVPGGATKLAVARALAVSSGTGRVLCIGDSGSPLGNDRELLSGPYGVSVDSVCGSHPGTWTLFGSRLRGPDALLRLLRAARVEDDGMRIDLSALGLDQVERIGAPPRAP